MAYLNVRDGFADAAPVSATPAHTASQVMKGGHLLEHAALGASFLCMIHCLALPLLIAALPALGSLLPTGPGFHLAMLAFAVPASGLSLLSGQRRHGTTWPLKVGTFGLLLLVLGVLGFEGSSLETRLTVLGATLLAAAHISNLRLRNTGCRAEHRF